MEKQKFIKDLEKKKENVDAKADLQTQRANTRFKH